MDADTLLKIDGDLDSQEVEELKFLCREHVPHKRLETVEAAQDLFLRLQDQDLLQDRLFLAELLLTVRRLDLLRHLGTSQGQVERALSARAGSYSGVSPYRKMLFDLYEDVTEPILKSFKFLLRIPRNRLESCTSFLDVLVEMEKQDILSADKVDELQRVLQECSKPLAGKVQTYKEHLPARGPTVPSVPGQGFPGHVNSQPRVQQQNYRPSVQESSPSGVFTPVSLTSVSSGENQSLYLDARPEHPPDEDLEDYYKTSSQPLGYCLIINNYSFKEARMNKVIMGDRKGTDQDAEVLQQVFSRLHFQVEVRRDQTGEEMQQAVLEFARKDHKALDVFVCCVLSHGEKGSVYAVDGTSVPIRALTLPFTSTHCRALALKPKLFFIQACQGQDLQRGALIQADGPGEEEEEEELEEEQEEEREDYRADAGRILPDTAPDDSDFLLGMATVEDYQSFRSVTQGSIFIQELCRQLVRGCERKEDILTIMTRVNREVSNGVYRKSKQMPEPRYTLRKKLVLPID
ncbi:caspase-8-like [Conger conger]|uniref:caspase-8-like n=1 Tax=Conger conger TaxID=82655 RepID=UPI002A5A6E45|nr:caspase-8-like [Conger conger]XP_061082704.1 caspase-8-like [Conger conger]